MPFIKRSFWVVGLIFAASCIAGLLATGMTVNMGKIIPGLVFIAFYSVLFFVTKKFQMDSRVVTFLSIVIVALAFTPLSLISSYTSVALQRPLIDGSLVQFDRSLGFDWAALYAWANAGPIRHLVLAKVYDTFFPQIFLLIPFLCYRGQHLRAWELLWTFWVSCLACHLVSTIWQSVGAFGFYHIGVETSYVPEFMALYEQKLKTIGATPVQGLIQFPSLHAAGAVLYIYAARGEPVLFPLVLALNALMLVALLPFGGHHLADLLGGVFIAGAAIAVFRKWTVEGGSQIATPES